MRICGQGPLLGVMVGHTSKGHKRISPAPLNVTRSQSWGGQLGRELVAGARLLTLVPLVTWAGAHSVFMGMLRQQEDTNFKKIFRIIHLVKHGPQDFVLKADLIKCKKPRI